MSGRSDSRSETPRSSENQPDDDKQEVSYFFGLKIVVIRNGVLQNKETVPETEQVLML